MQSKRIRIDYSELEYTSYDGKLWVRSSPYSREVEEYLTDDEMLIVNYKTFIYRAKINKKQISLERYHTGGLQDKELVDALSTIASTLVNIFPDMPDIKLRGRSPRVSSSSGNSAWLFDSGDIVEDNRQNHPDIVFIPSKNNEYYDKFIKFQKSKTSNRANIKDVDFIAIDKYLIVFGNSVYHPTIFNIEELLQEDDPISVSIDPTIVFPIKSDPIIESNTGSTYFYGIEKITLSSPQTIPKNAYLTDIQPKYIQFTRKGIVITNGIFFAKEPLEEVNSRNYIVEKTEDGWDIYVAFNSDYDGYYKITGNTVTKCPESRTNKISNTVNYPIVTNYITITDDELSDGYHRIKASKFFERTKTIVDGKAIYVPRKVIDDMMFKM